MRQLMNVPGEEIATGGTRRREFVKILTADAPADLNADTKNTTKLYHVHLPELPNARPFEVGTHGSQKPAPHFSLIAHRRSHGHTPHFESLAVRKRRKIGRRRLKPWILASALLALLVSATSYAGVSLLTAELLTRPSNYPLSFDARRLSNDATAWSVQTTDGVTLRGWYLPTAEHRHLIVLVHGMRSSWLEMAALGRDLHAGGYDVLLFDLRGHGQSDPHRLTMGRSERVDLCAVMSWAQKQGFTRDRIGWLGYSMGAATLLMEGAQNPDIQVAVVDSPFGDLPQLLKTQLAKNSHLPSWFNPGILAAAQWVYGVRTDDLIPIQSARAWGARPLLLIHGESDSVVPVSQAHQLARAAGASCLAMTLPGVDHVQAYETDPQTYVGTIERFFQAHLTP
jgi:alpha-beta hydrolase superfamily lysophospholipase